MNRAVFCTGGLIMLLVLAGCRSSIFQPDVGSSFHLPGWAGGKPQVPSPPDSLDGPDAGRAAVDTRIDEQLSPQSTATRLTAGRDAFHKGRLTEAAGHLQAVLQNQPKHVEAHHLMAIITERQHNYEASDQHFETAIAASPDNSNLLSDFGYSKLRRFDLETAESLLNRALTIDPKNSFALNNLGTVQARQGRFDDALTTLRRAGSEAEAQAKMAQLFPKGRPAIQSSPATTAAVNTAAITPVTADSPRSLPEPLSDPLPARRNIQAPSKLTSRSEIPLVPEVITEPPTESTPASPLTAKTAAHELIPAPAADLPSRPIPWNTATEPVEPIESGAGPITPVGATSPSRRIPLEFSRSAARLGLGIGPGSLVPGDTTTPTTTALPPQPITSPPVLEPTPNRQAPAPLSSDPLSDFEKELGKSPSTNRDAVRRLLNPPSQAIP
jgi:Tfp pilus assembly protein PilF